MSDQPTYYHYTAGDIHRYFDGSMTTQEMHALEKAALEDPLLSDALEGYAAANPEATRQDLAWLRSRFATKINRVFPWYQQRQWQVAASLLILAGLALGSYFLINRNESPEIAAVPQSDTISRQLETAPSNNPANTDSALVTVAPSSNPSTPASPAILQEKNKAGTLTKEELVAATDQTAIAPPATTTISKAEETRSLAKQDEDGFSREKKLAADDEKKEKKIVAPSLAKTTLLQYRFNGQVTDINNKPLAGATVIVNNKTLYTITNSKGEFNFSIPDSQAIVAIQSPGYTTANVQLYPNQSATPITLAENNASLNEVVVTGYNQNTRKQLQKSRAAAMTDSVYNLVPEDGWDNYNAYLKQYTANQSSKEMVDLVFDIDPEGKPLNITVKKTTSKKLNSKATKLLQQGPSWKATDSSTVKKGFLRIRF